jgi:hypothetical protein
MLLSSDGDADSGGPGHEEEDADQPGKAGTEGT